jgi:hypothetical protein
VKEAKNACAKTQQAIDAQESKLEQAMQQRKFRGAGGAGEIQDSIDDLKRRLDAEKAMAMAQSNTATQAIKGLAEHWASFNKTVHEQRAQTEKSIEAAKKKSTAESFAKLPTLQMHLFRVQKAEQEAEVLMTQADKARTNVAYLDVMQKIEQLRLSIASGPKTQKELDKQPMDFGILASSHNGWIVTTPSRQAVAPINSAWVN